MQQIKNLEALEKNLGIEFKSKDLLQKALTHRSYLNENPKIKESNERLEFLGDAILEFVVSNFLFSKFGSLDEGHLTALRSRLVDTKSLAQEAENLGIGKAILLSTGEERSGGRKNPNILADTLEAIIGAIFTDQGLEAARNIVNKLISIKIKDVAKKSLKDPKSLLQEYAQAQGSPAPTYKLISTTGPDHAKIFTVEVLINQKSYAKGTGLSKQAATKEAAVKALERWNA